MSDGVPRLPAAPARAPGFGWGVASILTALAIAGLAATGIAEPVDEPVVKALALTNAAPGWQIEAWRWVTWIGDPDPRTAVLTVAALYIAWKRQWPVLAILLVTVGVALIGNSLLKEAFGVERPALVPHLDPVTSLSLPSGHAANSAAIYLTVAGLAGRRWLWLAVPLVLLIGVSRVMLGVHWPSDVIAGWLFGGGCALIGLAAAARQAHPEIVSAPET